MNANGQDLFTVWWREGVIVGQLLNIVVFTTSFKIREYLSTYIHTKRKRESLLV